MQALAISDNVKNTAVSSLKGKSFSITLNVDNENQLPDIYELIDYKKSAR